MRQMVYKKNGILTHSSKVKIKKTKITIEFKLTLNPNIERNVLMEIDLCLISYTYHGEI